jgi:hypothetical protein
MELVSLSLKSRHCLLLTQILAHSFCADHTYYGMFYQTGSYVAEIRTLFNSNQIICIKYCNMPDASISIVKPTRHTSFSNLFWNATLHVSGGLSVHHQEFKTVHAATSVCQTDTITCLLAGMRWNCVPSHSH